ncbi:hypothetical protein [Anaeromyxobacter paludicola]|uniref:Membrane protein 6-pyruvoyl-tetrahydropterin synthase-related domain-containing protein n=1 Tax=Anaeromyxobacter paludicola TaxID=2918171 RepID=A0ABM7X9I4_9BACT|nr:hypothetical protein [Anaeromyxobacter paludicola]BDG08502.1 hypothetical protein AMPC_16150 [Anaeromyxobacter paludicola]
MADPRRGSRDRWLTAALCAGAAGTVALFASCRYLPMVDLPQHAAQIAIWKHIEDPRFAFQQQFYLDFGSPYLFGYAVARLLAERLAVPLALKVTVLLAVLGVPFSMRLLLRRTGADEWWCLLGFPLAFGVAFYWGLLNFLFAVPICVVFLAEAQAYTREPTRARLAWLLAFAAGLYLCHALILLFATAAAALVIGAAAGDLRVALRRGLPLALPAALALAWGAAASAHSPVAAHPVLWELGPRRLGELLALLFDFRTAPFDPRLPPDYAPLVLTGGIVLALAIAGARVIRSARVWAPAALAFALYLVLPEMARSVGLIYHRFAVMVGICLLSALATTASGWRRRLAHALVFACAVGWLGVLAQRFQAFDADARQFDAVRSAMEPRRSVVPLTFELTHPSFPELPVFLHFTAWYQASAGGTIGYSFAKGFVQPVRYRPGADPRMTFGLESDARRFDWDVDGHFDYFLARAARDPGPELFARATSPVSLEAHQGRWWLYRRRGSALAGAP